MQISTNIDFDLPTRVEIRERGEPNQPHGGYPSTPLVAATDHDQADVSLYCDIDEYGDGVLMSMHSYHITNPETGRAFHCSQKALLDWEQVRQLHRFLQFLLDCKGSHA